MAEFSLALNEEQEQLKELAEQQLQQLKKRVDALQTEIKQIDTEVKLQAQRVASAKEQAQRFKQLAAEKFVSDIVARQKQDEATDQEIRLQALRRQRSTLDRDLSAAKLEEALLYFLGDEAERLLRSGMSAVDLGAAPGGWTWILARRGLAVTAVDRGALSPQAQHAGAVRHLAQDAFPFRPAHPVDWLVCDIVDKPARVAELIERWFLNGWCRQAIFNLKLPMKQRYRDAALMLARIVAELEDGGGRVACTARQLYHDREEITVWLRRI